jgi:EmrB/QacA subfamily drug resistance transporter
MLMQQIDSTVLTVALPTMAKDFHVPVPALSLALTAYLLALAVFIPASGTLADRYGARKLFCGAIVLFLAGSIACAAATHLAILVAARFVQGVGGAMMVPVGRLVLLRTVKKSDLVQALSWVVMPALIGPIIGPPLGGAVVTYMDWRWIFYINVPVGLIGLTFALRVFPRISGARAARFDRIGFILSGLSLGCLLFGLELLIRPRGGLYGPLLLGAGLIATISYVAHARRVPNPILDLALMRIPTFRLSVVAGTFTRVGQGAQAFLMPIMLQVAFGMNPAAAGGITMAAAIGALAMKVIAPRILRRWGFRLGLTVGGLLASAAIGLCAAFRPDWPVPAMLMVLFGFGFLSSFLFTCYNSIAFADVDDLNLGSATSFYATFQQLALSVGICVAAVMLSAGARLWPQGSSLEIHSGALAIIAVISAAAVIWNCRFAPDAGAALSGHKPEK